MTNDSRADTSEVQTCDLLIRNGYVITMDAEGNKYPKGEVAINGREIVAVGAENEIAPKFRPMRVLDAGGAAVHPGYIDLHYHSSGHIMTKLVVDAAVWTEDAGPWASGAGAYYLGRYAEEEDGYASALLAGLDMLRQGYTMYMEPGTAPPDLVAAACEAVGIRATVADEGLGDQIGPQQVGVTPKDTKSCLNELGKQLWRNKDPNALVRAHVSIYGMGSQSDELMLAAKACADENKVVLNMHQSQSIDDATFDHERLGRPAYLHFAEIGALGENCVFVHNNILWPEEVQPIVDSGMSMCWVPGNSLFYASRPKFPNRMPELYHKGVNVSFGTDVSKTWTFGQNTFMAYYIAREEREWLTADDLLKIATINGAKAIGHGDLIGSLEPGKRADVVIRNNDDPQSYPIHFVERDLALYNLTKTVDTVIVDGRIVVKNGHHTLIDEQFVYDLAQKTAERVIKRAKASDFKPLYPI